MQMIENTGNLIYVENSYAWAQELENNNNNNIKRSWLDVQRITLISGIAFVIVLLGKNWIMCGTWQSSFFYTRNFSIGQHATIYLLTISLFSVLILLIPAQVFVRSNYWLSTWGVWSVWIRCNIYVIIWHGCTCCP